MKKSARMRQEKTGGDGAISNVKHYKVTKFRDNLKAVLDRVHAGETAVIDFRDKPYALVVPVEAPVARLGNYNYQLASVISERLLSGAPMHILKPQIEELAKLDVDDLATLVRITEFPLSKKSRKEIADSLKNSAVLERLEKRRKILDSILEAEREGLYEASEHATGMLTFDE